MFTRSEAVRELGQSRAVPSRAAPAGPPVQTSWLTFTEAAEAPDGSPARAASAWFQHFLMRPHPELGRTGPVCPYMARATRANLVRVGICDVTGQDGDAILALLRTALKAFDDIDCPANERAFRTVVIAFPGCDSREGVAALEKAQKRLRYRSALNGHMMGLFEPQSSQRGVNNRMFLPFRSPFPMIAIRSLVERDTPFMFLNPPMIPLYLARFGSTGCRRFVGVMRRRLSSIVGDLPKRR